ncbi:hypothetical protein AGDE_13236 [Angomonas deanei]|uniref:Uncharacterized protein n=1 Tax=Angomonas deanei TaxID=59799 RepID=A0A7G2CQL0_9TRYP|nr:hypothetical protein AGDE_13236 [Angomonas deanei]CAD2221417.1 hypothetical protein, conserved [Angomonas deanei]|eukprot:EPY22584.1 hypothetical protein AGDE_13236 [Angomonas deanei]
MSGCNASILGADSRSSSASSVVLKTVVKTLLTRLSNGPTRGSMNVSIVKLNGESVTDLLVSNGKSQKLVVAISPIFGSCVHGVSNRRVKTFSEFDSLLTAAKKRGSGESGRDHGLIFCSIILKLRVDGDVLVCSLSASFAGENIGVYNSVLDQSPLVPRALYHYALGGPCFTVALLGIGGDEKRANLMLNVQKRLGEVCNRPTNPGSIVKFISGIRNDAEPTIRRNYEETRSPELKEILDRLQEMVRDAEGLLKDFEKNEPKAYLSEQDQKENENKNNGGTRAVEEKKTTAKSSSADDPTRIHSIICYGQDLRGGGTVAVQENTVFVSSPGGAIRFDGDEVITLDEGEQLRDSEYMNRVIGAFLSGKNTGIITAETSIRYAFSLRALRKVAYQVLGVMCSGAVKNSYVKGPISGELELSMTLVKDDISADLLPVDVEAMYHRFELEGTPITGPRIAGVTSHMVHSHEEFDHFMSVGIDNVYPALETEDPGMMVVVLNLRQKVTKPTEDVLVSSLIFTAVFDAVHHYIDVLQDDPNEPLDIFKSILAAPATTIALFGISDEDTNADILLNTMSEICRIQNTPAKVNSTSQLIKDLKEGIEKMQQRMKSANAEEKAFLKARIDAAERMIKDASALLKYPFAEAPREFVPLGAGKF